MNYMIRDFHKSNVKCMIHCTIEVIKFNGGNDKDGASFFYVSTIGSLNRVGTLF